MRLEFLVGEKLGKMNSITLKVYLPKFQLTFSQFFLQWWLGFCLRFCNYPMLETAD